MKTCHFLALALLIATTACTPKNESGSLRITMPTSVQATGTKSAAPAVSQSSTVTVLSGDDDAAWDTTLNPATGPELNCFAVFVGGGGLVGRSCGVNHAGVISRFSFGERHFVGLVPSGSAVTIDDVPAGARVITVVGFKTATATNCAVNKLPDVQKAILSEPFVIASHAQNISPGQNEVSIRPALDLTKKLVTCDFNGNGGGQKNLPMFGDRRDGLLTLAGNTLKTLTTSTDAYGFDGDISHLPTAGGPGATKIFGAQRQIVNIDSTTGDVVTLASAVTPQEFSVGDEVLWYVSAGNAPTAPEDETTGACGSKLYRGSYGTRKIVSVNGTQLTLDQPVVENPQKIINANLNASLAGPSFCRISLTRVPNFDEVNVPVSAQWKIEPAAYNATTGLGGVVVMRTSKLRVHGTLEFSASHKGFAGGTSSNYSGSSLTGAGTAGAMYGNNSGGGSYASSAGGGGAGGGEGGSSTALSPYGGTPINHCKDPTPTSLSSGGHTNCATFDDGAIRCWGKADQGATGENGTSAYRFTPSNVATEHQFKYVSNGVTHACGITLADKLFCWGLNGSGQLGTGNTATSLAPVAIQPALMFKTVSAGFGSTCAIETNGTLKCWGANSEGQLGDGSATQRTSPVVINSGTTYRSVSVGKVHACGITSGNELKCWGDRAFGQVGDGLGADRLSPITIESGVQSVTTGWYHSCLIHELTAVTKCWGRNDYGQLGDGTQTLKDTPVTVAINSKVVSGGNEFTCAVDSSDRARCWGNNGAGQLGDGTLVDKNVPTNVVPSTAFKSVHAAQEHVCAVTDTNAIKCWGANGFGQLGNGTVTGASALNPVTTRTQNICHAFRDQKAFVGGGGGGAQSAGGNGGGLILIFAKETTGVGYLYFKSYGQAGVDSSYAGGGGGGGSIGFATKTHAMTGTTTLNAIGGAGGNGTYYGGGGGGGTIDMKYCGVLSSATKTFVVTPGVAGGGIANRGAIGGIRTQTTDLCAID